MEKLLMSLKISFMLLLVTFSACKKNKGNEESSFDINNPVGYLIYAKSINADGSWEKPWLFEFRPGKTISFYAPTPSGNGSKSFEYEIVNGNGIGFEMSGTRYVLTIENGKMSTNSPYLKEPVLIKSASTNQLSGKTFTGTYFNPDNTVKHSKFFYSFTSEGEKVDAGFNPGTTVRTEVYKNIGNNAAIINVAGTNDLELMVLVNGNLEVGYYQRVPYSICHGRFTKQ